MDNNNTLAFTGQHWPWGDFFFLPGLTAFFSALPPVSISFIYWESLLRYYLLIPKFIYIGLSRDSWNWKIQNFLNWSRLMDDFPMWNNLRSSKLSKDETNGRFEQKPRDLLLPKPKWIFACGKSKTLLRCVAIWLSLRVIRSGGRRYFLTEAEIKVKIRTLWQKQAR